VILYRCFARSRTEDALWFPRVFQGEGRHDNPGRYGCLYLADRPLSCIVEQLARFRGQHLVPGLLRRRGLPLALAAIELRDDASLIDLDDPAVLRRERLRPSLVATRHRDVTQPQAAALFDHHPDAAGLRWWSTWEASWANVTVFDRAGAALRVREVRELAIDDPEVVQAADFFGLRR
jgi:hypothetical protein